MEASKNFYNRQYESWMPWLEDKYLSWMGQNKTSYTAKGTNQRLHSLQPGSPAQRQVHLLCRKSVY